MYELVNVIFPFADDTNRGKLRPGFVVSLPFGKFNQVVVAYITTRLDDQLDTDILFDPSDSYFPLTGLKQKSLLKLHRLITLQPEAILEGEGSLPEELIPEVKIKLKKVFDF